MSSRKKSKDKFTKVPEPTVRRLSMYLRYLHELKAQGKEVISSELLAKKCQINSAQVRKDLSYFGEFGFRGVGYYVDDLINKIKRILGLDKTWNLCIVGVGNLGTAIYLYKDFLKENYKIVAAFDRDPSKPMARISEKLGRPVEILPMDLLPRVVKERDISIAILTVPPEEAQKATNDIVASGIKGILNFTPVHLQVPEDVFVKNVFFTPILDNLVYLLNLSREKNEGGRE